jgi:hypothetical protein
MRLLHVHNFELREFYADKPKYAILSHTWVEGEEITYQELMRALRDSTGAKRDAHNFDVPSLLTYDIRFTKILASCNLTRQHGIDWIWIDTSNINKENSAELSEAINSMYRWYAESSICFVYLADLPQQADVLSEPSPLSQCRWFTRGWTLQVSSLFRRICSGLSAMRRSFWPRNPSTSSIQRGSLLDSLTVAKASTETLRRPESQEVILGLQKSSATSPRLTEKL